MAKRQALVKNAQRPQERQAMALELAGQVVSTLVSCDPDSLVASSRTEVCLLMEGIEGDKHFGFTKPSDVRTPHYQRGTTIRNSRQVSIVSEEELEAIAATMGLPRVAAEWLGANLCLRGIPNLTGLPPATRLFFEGNAVLVVEGENLPCRYPGEIVQTHYRDRVNLATSFPQAAYHRRGVVAWVERPGVIQAGCAVRVQVPQQIIYSPVASLPVAAARSEGTTPPL